MSVKKKILRERRKNRVQVTGTAQKPRLSVYKSNLAVYAQLIDDEQGVTLAAVSSVKEKKKNIDAAKKVGVEIAKEAKGKKLETCVFDRNGYKYHGVVAAIADGAREGGLQF